MNSLRRQIQKASSDDIKAEIARLAVEIPQLQSRLWYLRSEARKRSKEKASA